LFDELGLNKSADNWKERALYKINKAQINKRLDDTGSLSMFYYKIMDLANEQFEEVQQYNEDDLALQVFGFRYDSNGRVFNMCTSVGFP
jgi:hypothetical protein